MKTDDDEKKVPHSPLPWKGEAPDPTVLVIYDAKGNRIVETKSLQGEDYTTAMLRRDYDSKLICRAVNAHDALVKSVETALADVEYQQDNFLGIRNQEQLKKRAEIYRQALRLARGE